MTDYMHHELLCLLAATIAMINANTKSNDERRRAVEDLLKGYRQIFRQDQFHDELFATVAAIKQKLETLHPGRVGFWLVGLVGVMGTYEVGGRRRARKFVGGLWVASERQRPEQRQKKCLDLIL